MVVFPPPSGYSPFPRPDRAVLRLLWTPPKANNWVNGVLTWSRRRFPLLRLCVDRAYLWETVFSVNDNLIPRLVVRIRNNELSFSAKIRKWQRVSLWEQSVSEHLLWRFLAACVSSLTLSWCYSPFEALFKKILMRQMCENHCVVKFSRLIKCCSQGRHFCSTTGPILEY